jgi:hypothetical protein
LNEKGHAALSKIKEGERREDCFWSYVTTMLCWILKRKLKEKNDKENKRWIRTMRDQKRTFLASMIMKKTPYTSHSLMGLSNCWKSNRSSDFFLLFKKKNEHRNGKFR